MDPSEITPKSPDAGADADSQTAGDVEFGFHRPEMHQSPLSGTVNPYDRHLFLCHKCPDAWPSSVEGPDSDPLPRLLGAAIKSRKSDMELNTRLTICEGWEGTEHSNGDILIFPDMIKYRGLAEEDVDSFVDNVLVKASQWVSGKIEPLVGSHVFVCCHGSRDRRCGVCGPALIKKFQEEVESRDLKGEVFVSPCSHVGGHKYAGNTIIFSSIGGKVTGHWYGYVTPDDVPILLDRHIVKGEIIERLWRGQMGVSVEPQKTTKELNVQAGTGKEKTGTEQLQEDSNIGDGGVVSCCQGANGISCCRDGEVLQEKQTTGGKVTSSPAKKDCNVLTSWLKTWEPSDTYAALAVIGAVASVTVAYSIYRRSS